MDDRERDHALKALEPAEDEGAVGLGAGERNNEVVTAGLGLEAAKPVGPDSPLAVTQLRNGASGRTKRPVLS